MNGLRAILVCVDYTDLLAITLPWNRHHFDEVTVVTSLADDETVWLANEHEARVFQTASFYDDGASFNKWKPLEEGLDFIGREGWLCLMDADVLWPKQLPTGFTLTEGCLHTPRRRMFSLGIPETTDEMFDEAAWQNYRRHRVQEFSGYSQIFHASDPVLGQPPWHEINWSHAGGADSFFQQKWPADRKIRPPFDVLHLGAAGTNWCGRATPYLDGTVDPKAGRRQEELTAIFQKRRATGSFDHEKVDRS